MRGETLGQFIELVLEDTKNKSFLKPEEGPTSSYSGRMLWPSAHGQM